MRAAILAVLLALAGCAAPPAAAPVRFNDADVRFVDQALTHHRDGIALVRLAASRPVRAEVRDMAKAIELTQTAEVESMTGWLAEWGATPAPDPHAGHGRPMSAVVAELAAAPDGDFERRFLAVLTGHQHGAVEMARAELAEGHSEPVRAFADRVVRSRTGQIKILLELT